MVMYKFVTSGHLTIETICNVTPDRVSQHLCIEGMAGIVEQVAVEKKAEMCSQLTDEEFRMMCLAAKSQCFNKDPELYYSVGGIPNKANNSELDFRLLSIYNHLLSVEDIEAYYATLGSDLILRVIEAEGACHDKSFNVGRVIYQHSRGFVDAVSQCKARCAGGCFHGALTQHFISLAVVSGDKTQMLSDTSSPRGVDIYIASALAGVVSGVAGGMNDGSEDLRAPKIIQGQSTTASAATAATATVSKESDRAFGAFILHRNIVSYFSSFCRNMSIWSEVRLHLNVSLGDCYNSLGFPAVHLSRFNTSLASAICASLDDRVGAYHCATGTVTAISLRFIIAVALSYLSLSCPWLCLP